MIRPALLIRRLETTVYKSQIRRFHHTPRLCNGPPGMIDILLLKGDEVETVRESQRKRFANVELVEDVMSMYKSWTEVQFKAAQLRKQINQLQKTIGEKKKAKENADDLVNQKKDIEKNVAELNTAESQQELAMRIKLGLIGNLVYKDVPISKSEDDNAVVKTWHPDGPNAKVAKREGILSHHEVMHRLDILDQDRGTKVAGHRGFFLINDGVDLNLALIQYGLDFLRSKGYKKVQPPFMMNRHMMAKTAQLEEFDESLYKLEGPATTADVTGTQHDGEKYLIATSEQPISAYHSDEWFESPSEQLPLRYAGYSTCFRKEAGAHGRDTWGIFRVHQFEKVEQFCITEPNASWAEFESMINQSEAFYQSLGLPYQVVSIVSGALNNAAAMKYDLEAWFPFQGEYKELVSVSNCTDYQSRALEVRCGIKKQGDPGKVYVHMLNGTLCATERAMCCVVENYQTEEGINIPAPLQKYMQGRTFIPYVKSLPKASTSQKGGKK